MGKLGNPEHTRCLVTEHPDGTLMLTSAVVMTAHEEALLGHPEIVDQVKAGLTDPSKAASSNARRP